MTNVEFFNFIIKAAKDYSTQGTDSIIRNAHMNDVTAEMINTIEAEKVSAIMDATVVDFCNYMAGKFCCDLALYTSDLKK